MKHLLLSLFFLSTFPVTGQTNKFDRLQADKVKTYVKVYDSGESQLKYTIDTEDSKAQVPLSLSQSAPTQIRVKGTNVNLLLDFFNPLRYTVSVDEKATEDKMFSEVGEFLKLLVTTLTPLNSGITLPSNTDDPAMAARSLSPTNQVSDLPSFIYTTGIANWYLWYKNLKITCPNIINTDNKLLNGYFVDAETYFYGNIQINEDQKNKFIDSIKDQLKPLIDADNLSDLKKAVLTSKGVLGKLETSHTNAVKAIDAIEGIANALTIPTSGTTTICDNLKAYTKVEFLDYVSKARKLLIERRKILDQFKKLLNETDEYPSKLKGFDKSGNFSIGIKSGENKNITIKLLEREVKITDQDIIFNDKDNAVVGYIEFVKNSIAILEVAPGLAYTNLSYQKYNLDQILGAEKYKVIDNGLDERRYIAATYLNIVFNAGLGPIYPMLQVGVGTGKELPTLLFGGGFRFTKTDLSLSYGYVVPFQRTPDKYQIGSEVLDAKTFEDDLTYKVKGKLPFYVGLQLKF